MEGSGKGFSFKPMGGISICERISRIEIHFFLSFFLCLFNK